MSMNIEEEGRGASDLSTKRCAANDGIDDAKWKFWKRKRYIVTMMTFFGFFNVLALRSNVSVAISAMTTRRVFVLDNETIIEEPEFDWKPSTQGLVLASYFYGYITTQILGGWLAARVGGNVIFGFGIAVTSLLTIFTPVLARINVYWFITIRVLEGIFEGVSYPSMHDLWAHWAPPLERNRLTTIGYSGSYIGIVVSMTVSGILVEYVGWPSVFYVFGGVGVVWYTAWLLLVRRGPQYDNRIAASERKYICESLGTTEERSAIIRHPWKQFFLSMPVWAIIVANFTENWGMHTLLTLLPTFMRETLKFDLQEAGVLSALPHLALAFVLQIAGQIADFLLAKNYLTTTQVRKLFCFTAFLWQSLFMLLTAFLLTPVGAITCLTLAVGLGAFATATYCVNHLDLAPRHASVLMGIGNTAGTMPGIISPTITGYLVSNRTVSEWRVVFYISSGIYLVGAIFYGIFASGERQSWAQEDYEKQVSTKEENVIE